jgi:hypothetical protein
VTTKPAAANLTAEPPMATEPAAAEPKPKPAAEPATEPATKPATEPATELAQASRRQPSHRRAPPGCRQAVKHAVCVQCGAPDVCLLSMEGRALNAAAGHRLIERGGGSRAPG